MKTYLTSCSLALLFGCASLVAQADTSRQASQVGTTIQETKPAQSTRITERNCGEVIKLPLGGTLEVSLPSNTGSTGYAWSLADSTPGILALQGDPIIQKEYRPIDSNPDPRGAHAIGSIQMQAEVWRFQAVARGETTLTFSSQRSWEKEQAPVEVITFTVCVE